MAIDQIWKDVLIKDLHEQKKEKYILVACIFKWEFQHAFLVSRSSV